MFVHRLVEGNTYSPTFFCFEFLSSGTSIDQISPAAEETQGAASEGASPEGASSEEACTGLWIATPDHTVTQRQPAASYGVLKGVGQVCCGQVCCFGVSNSSCADGIRAKKTVKLVQVFDAFNRSQAPLCSTMHLCSAEMVLRWC